ncbi:MAG: twin-arginine translocase TatA/TatE family subunit [Actinomycetota bacterium]|nr:twin-arginine translocase TatA/TatE family subunit [Actinomycetota bacterium]
MFGVGPSEFVMVFLLVLLLFGPSKLPQMARDLGRFIGEARRSVDEFKEELTSSIDEDEESAPHRKRGKNSTAKREKEPEMDTAKKESSEPQAEKEEEYDF